MYKMGCRDTSALIISNISSLSAPRSHSFVRKESHSAVSVPTHTLIHTQTHLYSHRAEGGKSTFGKRWRWHQVTFKVSWLPFLPRLPLLLPRLKHRTWKLHSVHLNKHSGRKLNSRVCHSATSCSYWKGEGEEDIREQTTKRDRTRKRLQGPSEPPSPLLPIRRWKSDDKLSLSLSTSHCYDNSSSQAFSHHLCHTTSLYLSTAMFFSFLMLQQLFPVKDCLYIPAVRYVHVILLNAQCSILYWSDLSASNLHSNVQSDPYQICSVWTDLCLKTPHIDPINATHKRHCPLGQKYTSELLESIQATFKVNHAVARPLIWQTSELG